MENYAKHTLRPDISLALDKSSRGGLKAHTEFCEVESLFLDLNFAEDEKSSAVL